MRAAITILVALLAIQIEARSAEPASANFRLPDAFSSAALVGLKVSMQQGERTGKVPHSVAACVGSLPSSSLDEVFAAFLRETFTSAEIKVAEEFFSSEVGRKYTKHGIIQSYAKMGEKAPEPLPQFSDSEYRVIERFSRTSAGEKIFVRRVLEGDAVRQALAPRIQELINSCDAR